LIRKQGEWRAVGLTWENLFVLTIYRMAFLGLRQLSALTSVFSWIPYMFSTNRSTQLLIN
jgi:hypothetical protein